MRLSKHPPGKRDDLKGWFETCYSPHDGGFYAMLWWNDETSPIFSTRAAAAKWAVAQGGDPSKEQKPDYKEYP